MSQKVDTLCGLLVRPKIPTAIARCGLPAKLMGRMIILAVPLPLRSIQTCT
jgi:hypothetical protein